MILLLIFGAGWLPGKEQDHDQDQEQEGTKKHPRKHVPRVLSI
jgi:hypothetical protein